MSSFNKENFFCSKIYSLQTLQAGNIYFYVNLFTDKATYPQWLKRAHFLKLNSLTYCIVD